MRKKDKARIAFLRAFGREPGVILIYPESEFTGTSKLIPTDHSEYIRFVGSMHISAIGLAALVAQSATAYKLPRFSYSSLQEPDVASAVLEALEAVGGIAIGDVPSSMQMRSGLEYIVDEIEPEGSPRVTWGGVVRSGLRSDRTLVNGDGNEVDAALLEGVRSGIENVGRLLGRALDQALGNVGDNWSDLVERGEGIEHAHSYETTPKTAVETSEAEEFDDVIGLHTDAGVLIVMTQGHVKGRDDDSHSLLVQLRSGEMVTAEFDSRDDIVVLVGEGGGANFMFDGRESKRLRPIPHKLVLKDDKKSQSQGRRGWYGRMYFPPKTVADYSSGGDVFRDSSLVNGGAVNSDILPGCRTLLDQGITMFGGVPGSSCTAEDGSDGIYCWKACVSVSSLDCGQDEAVCFDPVNNVEVDGTQMCPENPMSICEVQCADGGGDDDGGGGGGGGGDDGFCSGPGSTMFMDGFHWVLGGDALCLNFYFTAFTMSSAFSFCVGIVGVICMGISVEAIGAFRRKVHKGEAKKGRGTSRRFYLASLQFAQSLAGYVLMLSTMTYSIEMVLAASLGLAIGFAIFNLKGGKGTKGARPSAAGKAEGDVPIGGEPCCQDFDYDALSSDSDDDEEKRKDNSMKQK